jgi:hypothetical protein
MDIMCTFSSCIYTRNAGLQRYRARWTGHVHDRGYHCAERRRKRWECGARQHDALEYVGSIRGDLHAEQGGERIVELGRGLSMRIAEWAGH